MALSDLQLRNAKPKDSAYKLYDKEGLFVLVTPSGSRLWRLKYRFAGKERLLSLGRYPAVSIASARDRRDAARGNLAHGVDPGVVRKVARQISGTSFKEVATTWHENRKEALVPAHERRVWSRMERDVFPEIGERSITDISPSEILTMLRKVEERGSLTIAKRLRGACSHVFQFAAAEGLEVADPAAVVAKALKPSPRPVHMTKLPLDEMGTFMDKLSKSPSERTRLAIRLLILTWARTNEIRFAERHEFEDLDGPTPLWRIAGDKMKMGREHLVPLSDQAVSVARRLLKLSKDDRWLLPSYGKDGVLSQMGMLTSLYELGYRGRATIHGFRGVASTWANEALRHGVRRYDTDAIELALAHNDGDEVRSAYNAAQYLPARKTMLQDWANWLDAQMPDQFEALLG